MLKAEQKRRNQIFDSIKRMYENEILTFNMSSEALIEYSNSYLNIATMLESMKATRNEIKFRLGEEFEKWFFQTHDEVMDNFFNGLL